MSTASYHSSHTPDEAMQLMHLGYQRPWDHTPHDKNLLEQRHQNANVCRQPDGRYQICVDVHLFAPTDVTVKSAGNLVIIEGKHDEKIDDFGHVERHFVRKYPLPREYALSDVQSTLSSDGVLTVTVMPPKKEAEEDRVVPIHRTGPVRLTHENYHKEMPHKPMWHY